MADWQRGQLQVVNYKHKPEPNLTLVNFPTPSLIQRCYLPEESNFLYKLLLSYHGGDTIPPLILPTRDEVLDFAGSMTEECRCSGAVVFVIMANGTILGTYREVDAESDDIFIFEIKDGNFCENIENFYYEMNRCCFGIIQEVNRGEFMVIKN